MLISNSMLFICFCRKGTQLWRNTGVHLYLILNPPCNHLLLMRSMFTICPRVLPDLMLSKYKRLWICTFRYINVCHFMIFFFRRHFLSDKTSLLQEAKKVTKPYINQISTVTKPYVVKARTFLKPYTKKVHRGYKKFIRTTTGYHRQVILPLIRSSYSVHTLLLSRQWNILCAKQIIKHFL